MAYEPGVTISADKLTHPVRDQMREATQFYRAQRSVAVSVELAVFDDGLAVGPDQDNWLPRLSAWMDAERDFSRAALSASVRFSEHVRGTRDRGLALLPKPPSTARSGLLAAAETASTYTACYDLAKAYFAAQVADWIEQSGERVATERLRLITGTKQYPALHRY
jgi:hypothetical protein